MMARLKWYLDPLSPNELKLKKRKKVGPPLKKLSGSAHGWFGVFVWVFQHFCTFL